MPSQVISSSASPDARGSRWSWMLPAGTFVAGCVLGGVVVAVGDVGADDEPTTGTTAAVATDEGSTDEGSTDEGDGSAGDGGADAEDSGLYVRVPESCLQTADDATTLVEGVDRVVAAVADLDPERLRQTVDDVQQVRDEVQDVAEQCREAAAQRLEDSADAEGDDSAPATPAS